MCGRFANQIDNLGPWEEMLTGWPYDCHTGYNIAPTNNIPVLIYDRQNKKFSGQSMHWGLVPSWSKEANPKFSTFNARIESLAEKPAYRTAWKQSRTCLIPIRGYYEWKNDNTGKQPYFISLEVNQPIMLAGIWDIWTNQPKPLYPCSIITRSAKNNLSNIHSRMPVRVDQDHALDWLIRGKDWLHIISNLRYPDEFNYYPVSKKVNRPTNQGPDLINPYQSTNYNSNEYSSSHNFMKDDC
ncbi:MAG: SOS response-associated peptidase [Gammaproteobacteria bacterium]|nr:SOS response-associated peptidase [Gammaproteobacteria bacterium]